MRKIFRGIPLTNLKIFPTIMIQSVENGRMRVCLRQVTVCCIKLGWYRRIPVPFGVEMACRPLWFARKYGSANF